MESKDLAIALARALDAKKARNIRILRVHDLTTVTDYFVIATGTSTTHVAALADEADFQLGRQGVDRVLVGDVRHHRGAADLLGQ